MTAPLPPAPAKRQPTNGSTSTIPVKVKRLSFEGEREGEKGEERRRLRGLPMFSRHHRQWKEGGRER